MYKAAAPINLGGPIKSYQSVGAGGWMVLFRLTFLRSSSADALVSARRWRVRWSRRDVERSHEIGGAGRRRVDETSCRISEAGEENDGGGRAREGGRTEGASGVRRRDRGRKEARKVSRPCSIPSSRYPAMWYTCRESCCIVSNVKVYPGGKGGRRDSANLRDDRPSISPSTRYI